MGASVINSVGIGCRWAEVCDCRRVKNKKATLPRVSPGFLNMHTLTQEAAARQPYVTRRVLPGGGLRGDARQAYVTGERANYTLPRILLMDILRLHTSGIR